MYITLYNINVHLREPIFLTHSFAAGSLLSEVKFPFCLLLFCFHYAVQYNELLLIESHFCHFSFFLIYLSIFFIYFIYSGLNNLLVGLSFSVVSVYFPVPQEPFM